MDDLISIVQDDHGFDLNFTLKDSTGTVVNLTGSTLSFIAQSVSDDSVEFTGSMSIVSAVAGTCKYTVQATDFKVSGSWTAQIEVNYGVGTEIITFSGIRVTVIDKLPVS